MSGELDLVLGALADPTRRAVVALLRRRPLRPGEIASTLRTSRPAMSRHLRVLRRAGLVEESFLEGDARGRVYRLQPRRLAAVRRWLADVEAFWGDQLAGFKAHAERHGKKSR